MSAQPWQHSGATVYQLTDDGTQNLWSAHVNGPKSSRDDDCKTAQKMAAAPDMYEALMALFYADMEKCMLMDGKEDQIEAIAKARAALAKARDQ